MATFVDLATNIFNLNGIPLAIPYKSMRHLWPIYNRPDSSVLLKFGRQTHKSTTTGYKISLPCIKFHNYHTVYVAPTGNQVSVFSTDKLDSALRGSKVIQDHYIDTRTKDQVQYKELVNESKIYLRSAFHSADSIRGISGDMTCIDEAQDILSDHIPIIEQCMSHSLSKWQHLVDNGEKLPMHMFNHKMYAGTPKSVENTLEHYWLKSTQNEWIIKCQHCNKWNYINEHNVGEVCLICSKCGKPIFYEHGQWVTMNKKGFIAGYRVPQIILDWINNPRNPQVWQTQVIQPRSIYTSQKFFNEILALPYANAKNPININDLRACCQDYDVVGDINHEWVKGNKVYAGIDWGKGDITKGTSYTVLVIGAKVAGKFKVLFIKKYMGRESNAAFQWRDILSQVNAYGCQLTLADTGDGRTSNAEMVNNLGTHRFAEVFEHGGQKRKIKFDGDSGTYIINRTQIMTDRFMEIKHQKVHFFKYEQFEQFQDDFLGIYSDYSEKTRLTRYDHTVPDDVFHAFMFCRLASMISSGEMNKYLAGGENEDVGLI